MKYPEKKYTTKVADFSHHSKRMMAAEVCNVLQHNQYLLLEIPNKTDYMLEIISIAKPAIEKGWLSDEVFMALETDLTFKYSHEELIDMYYGFSQRHRQSRIENILDTELSFEEREKAFKKRQKAVPKPPIYGAIGQMTGKGSYVKPTGLY